MCFITVVKKHVMFLIYEVFDIFQALHIDLCLVFFTIECQKQSCLFKNQNLALSQPDKFIFALWVFCHRCQDNPSKTTLSAFYETADRGP